MLKLLIIADPLEKLNIHSDSTYLLLLTAHDLNIQISYCLPGDVYAYNDQALANVAALELAHGVAQIHTTTKWFRVTEELTAVALTHFDAIMVRNDPPFNLEYYYLTQILTLAERAGTKVINHATALRNFNEKLAILNFPELIVPTLVSKNKVVINEFINQQKLCVAKPIDLMAGREVFKLAHDDANKNVILEALSRYYTQTIMVQRFIPEVVQGDKRIFIINGEVINHCVYRIPQSGEIRGNLAAGGRSEVHPLQNSDYQIAQPVANWAKQQGILIAGIDVIGSYLTEVNITSPTAMQAIYQQTGINIAELILSALIKSS